MRTKTPKQINEQTLRLMKAISIRHWNGKEYEEHAEMLYKLKNIMKTCWCYIDNIYAANGIKNRHKTNDTAKCNDIWLNAATPVSIYAKNVNN